MPCLGADIEPEQPRSLPRLGGLSRTYGSCDSDHCMIWVM